MLKPKLNFWDLFDRVHSVMKTRQDNDMTNRTGAFYTKNDIELLWPIRLGVIYDKNKTWQWRN